MTEYLERIITEQRNKLLGNAMEEKAAADAWRAVTRNRKKDGKDFAYLDKNFTGCKFYTEFSLHKCNVYYRVGYRYSCDTIYLDGNSYGAEPIDTADKVEAAIKQRIELREAEAAKSNQAYNDFSDLVNNILPHMDALRAAFKAAGKEYDISTEYALRKIIEDYVR